MGDIYYLECLYFLDWYHLWWPSLCIPAKFGMAKMGKKFTKTGKTVIFKIYDGLPPLEHLWGSKICCKWNHFLTNTYIYIDIHQYNTHQLK